MRNRRARPDGTSIRHQASRLARVDLDAVEVRVLGCLLEKQRTTPDAYPLSLNALRLACNQSTSRYPVVEYDEPTIRKALDGLSRLGWTRLASGAGSRAAKYRQLFDEAIGVDASEVAVLAVLMLRGPQTLGELKQRTERMHYFASLDDIAKTLDGLAERELAMRKPRRPGERDDRYVHLLGRSEEDAPAEVEPAVESLEQRVARLEDLVADLQRRLPSA
jgi:uncharacterized protein YceH (UPF0502 family)